MPDREKVIKGLESQLDDLRKYADVDEEVILTQNQAKDIVALLKGQLQIVRCRDCKYLIDHYGFMDDGYCKKMREGYNAKLKPEKDWFCADGQRAENARLSSSEIPNS